MIRTLIDKYIFRIFYGLQFRKFGSKSMVLKPLKIRGFEKITIGNNTIIQSYSWLEATSLLNDSPELQIGNNVQIGHFNHIIASQSIIIEDSVLTANNVYISDNNHNYENTEIPILNQGINQLDSIVIGKGSWIGENVCIIGASIGENCVIGSNAVVTKSIPDRCVAVGAPARIIKKYNVKLKKWEKI